MKNKTLVGLFFHSFDADKKVKWQGRVESSPVDGWYLVQLFEWGFGCDSSLRIVDIGQMRDWIFYPSAKAMRESWETGEVFQLRNIVAKK